MNFISLFSLPPILLNHHMYFRLVIGFIRQKHANFHNVNELKGATQLVFCKSLILYHYIRKNIEINRI